MPSVRIEYSHSLHQSLFPDETIAQLFYNNESSDIYLLFCGECLRSKFIRRFE